MTLQFFDFTLRQFESFRSVANYESFKILSKLVLLLRG